ncbi:MAG: phenylalanine--tRNA ligase subunit alpha [Candidatus Bilamarchaeaceae archaeon]
MIYKGEREIAEYIKNKKTATIEEISESTGIKSDAVRKAIESLKTKEIVKVEEKETYVLMPTEEYKTYVSVGFPEYSVYIKSNKNISVAELTEWEKKIGLKWAKEKGFINIEGGKLKPKKTYEDIKKEIKKLEDAFSEINKTGRCDKVVEEELFKRHLVQKKNIKQEIVSFIEDANINILEKEGIDLNVEAEDALTGRLHPLSQFTEKIKEIMVELGFEEMEGSIIQSAFWNFDALFQPQDHPARELADTFYIDKKSELPKEIDIVKKVAKAHEKGWKMKWKKDIAEKTVLRTHTTALSAQYLSGIKDKKPRKYFAIGRVFRNEATDYKHLAEFHQIEGIIVWEKATFRDLLGVLKEFYKRLGFEKIRFRPSYFPYTEPSLEIEVFYEDRKQWMELGGAGMFRPEVSIPLCGVYPVLAWGLSLERPLMLSLQMTDIRDFYKNDLGFLKSNRLKL